MDLLQAHHYPYRENIMIARRSLFNAAVVLFTVSSALVASAAGELKKIGTAQVQFFALGPAGMKINGETNDLKVKDADGKLTLITKMGTFSTGIGLRDRHLKKYMETEKYPDVKLVVDKIKIKMPADKATSKGSVKGTLTLHGKTKDVSFDYQAKRMGSDYLVQGKFGVDIVNYGVEQPCYLGVCMETAVKMKASFKLRQ